jgi:CheY-like chemotaxis protein/nitrogen-specific signal transduction histidine kinase
MGHLATAPHRTAGPQPASARYKSEFIANMSHEIRTPLNSLLMLAEQLQSNPDGNMTDAQVEYAQVIRSSGNDILNLLGRILDLAKLESGAVAVELSDLSLADLRASLLQEFAPAAQAKAIGYTVEVLPGAPEVIVTDPRRLRRILSNLLNNAFKFTEKGQVLIQIGPAARGWAPETTSLTDAPGVVCFRVIDSGIGISHPEQRRIFEPFAQADSSEARLYGGTGLGLAISRELVSLLGGDITVESASGSGTTFTLFLPASGTSRGPTRPSLVERRRELWQMPAGGFDGAKVLLVDNDFRNIFAMTALLERCNAKVTVAENGAAAITTLQRMADIDLVLMDIMMPIMDGYETIRAIRAMRNFRTVPIIAVTAKVNVGERQRCLDAGADDFIPKPTGAAELVAALRPFLDASRRSRP